MGVFLLGGMIPALLGLAVFFCATYQALVNKRIKRLRLDSDQDRPAQGGEISCCVIFEADIPFEVDKVSAGLKAEEIVDFRGPSRKNGKSRTYLLYESKRELPLAVKRFPTRFPFG